MCILRRLPGALNTYLLHLLHVASTRNANGSENMSPFHEIWCILVTLEAMREAQTLTVVQRYYYYVDKVNTS